MEMNTTTARIHGYCSRRLLPVIILACLITGTFISAWASDSLLIVREEGGGFTQVLDELHKELEGEFALEEFHCTRKSTARDLSPVLSDGRFKLVVLIDNKAIALFREFQITAKDQAVHVPSVSCCALYVDKAIAGLKNAAAISFEVPPVTSLVDLRSVVASPVSRVGVIYRAFNREFIDKNRAFCRDEKIEFVTVELPNKSIDFGYEVKKALKTLCKGEKIDALWLPNDNALLTPEILRDRWIPLVQKCNVPVVVGVDILVSPELDFGSFSVTPDLSAYALQVAQLIFELQENGWQVPADAIQPPLSVNKTLNLTQVRKKFGINDGALRSIDKILE